MGSLTYFKQFFEQMPLFHESEIQTLIQKITTVKRNVFDIQSYAEENYQITGFENILLDRTQKIIIQLSNSGFLSKKVTEVEYISKLNQELFFLRKQNDKFQIVLTGNLE